LAVNDIPALDQVSDMQGEELNLQKQGSWSYKLELLPFQLAQ
jgi:hypothetical protein